MLNEFFNHLLSIVNFSFLFVWFYLSRTIKLCYASLIYHRRHRIQSSFIIHIVCVLDKPNKRQINKTQRRQAISIVFFLSFFLSPLQSSHCGFLTNNLIVFVFVCIRFIFYLKCILSDRKTSGKYCERKKKNEII